MKAAVFALALLCLAGCKEDARPDQCLRAELFKSCMAALPAGPVSTKYNDWEDVVDSCESSAKNQSWRPAAMIKKECRPY